MSKMNGGESLGGVNGTIAPSPIMSFPECESAFECVTFEAKQSLGFVLNITTYCIHPSNTLCTFHFLIMRFGTFKPPQILEA